jgi:hypothetical protein
MPLGPVAALLSAAITFFNAAKETIPKIASLLNRGNTGLNSGQLATAITDPGSQQSERPQERRERRQAEEQRRAEEQRQAELNNWVALQEQSGISEQIFQT